MGNIKRHHAPKFKAEVALALIQETDTIAAICSKHGIHPTQAGIWKQQALAGLATIFADGPTNALRRKDQLIEELYRQVGQLIVELDWLKKKVGPG